MNKREARLQAYMLSAKMIENYIKSGCLEAYHEWGSEAELCKVSKELYVIADGLRDKHERLQGDDGDD